LSCVAAPDIAAHQSFIV